MFAPHYWLGVEHVGGDMFASVPKGDVIFMKVGGSWYNALAKEAGSVLWTLFAEFLLFVSWNSTKMVNYWM